MPPGDCSIPSHIFARGEEKGLMEQSGIGCFRLNNSPLSRTACDYYPCCYSFFSCLTAVSIKLFLSPPMILTFLASNSPVQPTAKEGGERAVHGFSGNMKLENTIPKP